MSVKIVEHNELKLIGIPCVSLKNMPEKFKNAKEGLLAATKQMSNVVNNGIVYGIWPQSKTQQDPDTHVYILCLEVSSFENVPEWFFKTTLPPQKCVVAVDNSENCYDAAGEKIAAFINENEVNTSSGDRVYTICESNNLASGDYMRYSLPILNQEKVKGI